MKKLTVVLLAVSLLIASCYGSRTATEICSCQLQRSIDDDLLTSKVEPPPHFEQTMIQRTLPDEYAESFNGVAIVWYQHSNGESVACVVLKESDRVNGLLTFSADESIAEPIDLRWLGIPFGRERKPWEKC